MRAKTLTAERLRELLQYDPKTGAFTWRVHRNWLAPAGSLAGWVDDNGYIEITIDGRSYRANRLAWLYVTGAWPVNEVDHKDTDRANDRFLNLRDATRVVNMQNQREARAGKGQPLGVSANTQAQTFRARITVHGNTKYLGSFSSADEAKAAYIAAKRQLHEGNTL